MVLKNVTDFCYKVRHRCVAINGLRSYLFMILSLEELPTLTMDVLASPVSITIKLSIYMDLDNGVKTHQFALLGWQ